MTAPIRERICGAVSPGPDGVDCVCLQPEHDDVPHLCDAPGCGREWTDTPLGRTA